MKRFEKILAFVLSLVLLFVQMPMVIGAEETRTQTKNREYYVVPQGTGDGRTPENPAGDVGTVVNSVNADGLGLGDTATVYIDGSTQPNYWNSATMNSQFIQFNSGYEHDATIVYTSLDVNKPAKIAFVTEYGGNGGLYCLFVTGPTVFKDVYLIDQQDSIYSSRTTYLNGNNVTFQNVKFLEASDRIDRFGDSNPLEDYRVLCTGGYWWSRWNIDVNPYGIGTGGRVSIDSSVLVKESGVNQIIYGWDLIADPTVQPVFNNDTTLETNGGKLEKLYLTSAVENGIKKGCMTFNKNVNLVANNKTVINTFATNKSNISDETVAKNAAPVVKGAIQIVLNDGSTIGTNSASAYSSTDKIANTPVYILSSAKGASGSLDVTDTAGVYKVIAKDGYCAVAHSTTNGSSYKSVNGILTVPAGEYTVTYDVIDDEPELIQNAYYIAPEGIGDGRTSEKPAGSVERVIKSINEDGLGVGDTATVYIDGSAQPNYWNSPNLSSKFIQFNSGYEHDATIVYTSLDVNKPAKIAFVAEYGGNGGLYCLFVTGPTVFKDVYLIDQQNSIYSSRTTYLNGNNVTFKNVKFLEAADTTSGFMVSNPRDDDHRVLATGGYWWSRWNINVNTYGIGNGGRVKIDSSVLVKNSGVKQIIYGWDLITEPTVAPVFNNDATLETNGGTLDKLYLTNTVSGLTTCSHMTYNKNVNLVANNKTVINTFATNKTDISDETAAKNATPIVKGAIQIVLNGGSSITNNSVYAYSDNTKTTKTPIYIIRNESNTLLDVTENAGEYSVNGEKTLYTVVDNKLYYGNSSLNLKVPSAGEYDVYQADSLSEIINSVSVEAPDLHVFDGWIDDGNGILTAKFKVGEKKRYMLKVVNDGELCAPLCQNVTLEKGKTYTVSYKYKFVTGYMDTSLYFFVGNAQNYKGGDGKVYYMSCYTDTRVFDSVKYDDNIAQVEYTFTLTDRYNTDGEAYYTIPEGKSLCSTGFIFENAHKGLTTELYIADMVLYETGDVNKKNLLPVTNYSNSMNGWGCQWKGADMNSSSFTHSSCDYIATYEPLDEGMFKYSAFGDANQDKVISITDLVRTKKLISNDKYIITADAGRDGVLNAMDLTLLRKHLLGIEEIETLVYPNKIETGYSDAEALALKNTIESTSDSVTANTSFFKTTYYVDSVSGKDSNTGKSKNSPLKTLDALSQKTLKSGDVVLFKRGSVFRSDKRIKLVSGVSYGAYGSGEKPIFMGSLKDYAKCDWQDMGNGIWKLSETVSGQAGIVTFDANTTFGFRKESISQLLKNGDYYHDYKDTGSFYLKLGGKNPADYFNNIEICSADYAFFGIYADSNGRYQRENITVNNISFMYYGSNCIDLAYCSNIKITGCEFRYIGGNNFSSTTRAGNAITIWNTCDGVTVNNCLFYEIFDAPFTFQGDDSHATYEEISVTNCLIEYTSMNYEFWGTNVQDGVSILNDIKFSNNIVRFAGLGFGGIQRKIKTDQGVILGWDYKYDENDSVTDFVISNNIFDTSDCYIFRTSDTLPIAFSGNKYYQGKSSFLINRASSIKAVDQVTLEEAIATFDTNASVIKWID